MLPATPIVIAFQFWLMFGFAVGCALALVIYDGAICVFANQWFA